MSCHFTDNELSLSHQSHFIKPNSSHLLLHLSLFPHSPLFSLRSHPGPLSSIPKRNWRRWWSQAPLPIQPIPGQDLASSAKLRQWCCRGNADLQNIPRKLRRLVSRDSRAARSSLGWHSRPSSHWRTSRHLCGTCKSWSQCGRTSVNIGVGEMNPDLQFRIPKQI